MQLIKIVGIGNDSYKQLTIEAWETINSNLPLYSRTSNHPVIKELIKNGYEIITFDSIYENSSDYNELIEQCFEKLTEAAKSSQIIYLVPGCPTSGDLLSKKLSEITEVEIIPGLGLFETMSSKLGHFSEMHTRISAMDINVNRLSLNYDLFIDEIEDINTLSELKLKLLEIFPQEHVVYIVEDEKSNLKKAALFELDRDIKLSPYTSILVPALKGLNNSRHDFSDLLEIVRVLREPGGCPWDMEQDHLSILNNLTEEAYELIAAFKKDDRDEIVEELGDVLMQVVFHAQIGTESGDFNIYDIVSQLVNKLYFRHPHVFGEINVDNSEEVLYNWDILKQIEKKETSITEYFNRTKGLPAMIRSQKISGKARSKGFDWNSVEGVLDKITEELNEVKFAIENEDDNRDNVYEEIGDLFFSTVSLCSFLDLNAEEILQSACDKFIKRFSKMEKTANDLNLELEDISYELWDNLWNKAKH